MNDNVLLIGASGFVGTRLLETAIADFNIKNLDKQQSHFYPEITQIGDVRDQQALDQALAGFDTVVLLAAEHRDDVSPTSLYYDVNRHPHTFELLLPLRGRFVVLNFDDRG
ncbi:NAD-dependent epimerase/dehydratase family protein, partial [Escherichia coli]|nr:NAD-dependent epimerase/dehydratase family protein [Escherichia coli]